MKLLKNLFTKKFLLIFGLVVVLMLGMGQKEVRAATPINTTSQLTPIGDVINNQTNPNTSLEKWVIGAKDSAGTWVQRGMTDIVIEGLNCQMDGCPTPQQLQSNSYNGGGAISFTTNLMGLLFEAKPISSTSYLASIINSIFGEQPVYAQNLETGTNGLNAIIDIWKIFRNISYVFFVVIFVVIGFMIMFRQKVDPQTVVSVENSLPKIVVALVLVTLSYAISGLMIDISNIATVLFATALTTFHNGGSLSSWMETIMGTSANPALQKNIFQLLYSIGSTSAKNLTGPISAVVSGISVAISIITGPLAELILNVAIIGALFKTFFALLGSYVSIIFLTITSPIIFMSSALPGKGDAVTKWIKDMLANTLVFPVTFIFLFLGAIIAEEPGKGANALWQVTSGVNFAQPWIPFGLAGFGAANIGIVIKELVAFGIVMAAPTIPGMVKEFFETKESALSAGTAQGLQSTLQRIPIIGSMLG